MTTVKQFDNALCRPRGEIGRLIRSRCFNGTSKAVSQSNCFRDGFIFPRPLNYLGYSKASATERRVGVVRSELDYSTATKERGVLA
jgi:hypothetical protein